MVKWLCSADVISYISSVAPLASAAGIVLMNDIIFLLSNNLESVDLDFLAIVGVVTFGAQCAKLAPVDRLVTRWLAVSDKRGYRRVICSVRRIEEEGHAEAFRFAVCPDAMKRREIPII